MGKHPIGQAEGEPWRRSPLFQVGNMAQAAPGFVRAGRPRSRAIPNAVEGLAVYFSESRRAPFGKLPFARVPGARPRVEWSREAAAALSRGRKPMGL